VIEVGIDGVTERDDGWTLDGGLDVRFAGASGRLSDLSVRAVGPDGETLDRVAIGDVDSADGESYDAPVCDSGARLQAPFDLRPATIPAELRIAGAPWDAYCGGDRGEPPDDAPAPEVRFDRVVREEETDPTDVEAGWRGRPQDCPTLESLGTSDSAGTTGSNATQGGETGTRVEATASWTERRLIDDCGRRPGRF
jgi:hypothetical protein